MTNAFNECILSRSAANYYDPTATLSDYQICNLIHRSSELPRERL